MGKEQDVPFVSPVIGDGADAHRKVKVGDTSLTLHVGFEDEQARVPGRELAGMLDYSRDRDFFRLVKRLETERPDFGAVLYRATVAPLGNRGGTRIVEEPFVTERQSLLLAMCSDTDAAWRVKTILVDVFLALKTIVTGLPAPPEIRQLLARFDSLERENAVLQTKIDLMDPCGSGVIGKAKAERWVLGPIREASRIACQLAGEYTDAAYRRERNNRENQLRLHVHFPASREQRIENLPSDSFGDACNKASEILGRERARLARWEKELRARTRQGVLVY